MNWAVAHQYLKPYDFQGGLSDENLKTSLKLKLQLNGDSGYILLQNLFNVDLFKKDF